MGQGEKITAGDTKNLLLEMSSTDDLVNLNVYIGFIYFCLFFFSAGVVYYFAEPGFPWHTYITLTIGYYVSFGILLLVPIDIATVIIDRCQTSSTSFDTYESDIKRLSYAYRTFFNAIIILGSFVLVFEEYYNTDGYFTLAGKLWSSFKRMFLDMILGVVAGVIILGILIGQHVVAANSDALQFAAIIVTNIVYEAFLMFLLAYGMVELPRAVWNSSNYDYYLLLTQIKATAAYESISETRISIQDRITEVIFFKAKIMAGSDDKLKQAITILQEECTEEFKTKRKCDLKDAQVYMDKKGQITLSGLATLRGNLKIAYGKYKVAQLAVQNVEATTYWLEDVIAAKGSGSKVIHNSITHHNSTPGEYTWHIVAKPILLKILAVVLALLSILSFLGVVGAVNGVQPSTSPYFQAVHNPQATGAAITIFILLTLGYTCYVTLWSLFEMRLPGLMELIPGRTPAEGLSFNVRMVARLAAPLAFFYLTWIAEAGVKVPAPWTAGTKFGNTYLNMANSTEMSSAFSNFYQISSLGHPVQVAFGTAYPIILFILLPLIAFNLLNRFLVLIKMGSYQFGTPFPTEEQLRVGKKHLTTNRKRAEARARREAFGTQIHGRVKGGILSLFRRREDEEQDTAGLANHAVNNETDDADERPTIVEPEALSGQVERKGSSSLGKVGASWKEMHAEVKSPGHLYLFKDKASAVAAFASSKDPATLSNMGLAHIDLRLITEFTIHFKKANEVSNQLELETPAESIKLRFKTVDEMQRWRDALIEWKDFNLFYGDIYPFGMSDDVERGSVSKGSAPASKPTAATPAPTPTPAAGPKFPLKSPKAGDVEIKAIKSPPVESKADDLFDEKPARLEGWLEKKSNSKIHVGSDWQKRYCVVDQIQSKPNKFAMAYYKTDNTKQPALESLDLVVMGDISAHNKGGKSDTSRFSFDLGDKVYKFRAANPTEGEKWVKALCEWKDYACMNM